MQVGRRTYPKHYLDYYSVLIPILEELERRGYEITKPRKDRVNLDAIPFERGPSWHVIQVPHSIGGDTGDFFMSTCIKEILTPGKYFIEYWTRGDPGRGIRGYPIALEKFKLVGFPKTDTIFRKVDKEEIISKYSLKLPYERTLFYAPSGTDSPRDQLDSFELSIGEVLRITKKLKVNLILKPKSSALWKRGSVFKEVIQKIAKEEAMNLVETKNVCELFHVTNFLLSDGSSCIREFYLVGPSLQLTNFNNQKYVFPEAHHTTLKDLEKNITSILKDPDSYLMSRQIKEDLFFKLDGRATERAVDVIENYIRRNKLWS